MHIGQSIKKKREEQGATQEEVAFRAGTDASNLSRMERGLQKPSLDMLEQIAAALGTTVSALYVQTETRQAVRQLREEPASPYGKGLRQLQRSFVELNPNDQKLVLEFVKLLGRSPRQDS
jgi:transcriptional regulator with XRE-family HTH domain